MKPTTVEFAVPQNALASVVDNFNKNSGKLPVTAFSSDNTRQIATGELYALGNQMATGTGTVMLRASFPNEDEALYPNEFVNVKLLVDTLHGAVLVPTPAVQTGAPGTFVYLANANNTVSVHKVTTGPSDGKNTVILAGLTQGQNVVTDGTDRLSDGAKIKPAKPQAASSSVNEANAEIAGTDDDSATGGKASASHDASGAHGHHHPASGAPAASSN
jgi:multidrug efflux system membrane fusion protein